MGKESRLLYHRAPSGNSATQRRKVGKGEEREFSFLLHSPESSKLLLLSRHPPPPSVALIALRPHLVFEGSNWR